MRTTPRFVATATAALASAVLASGPAIAVTGAEHQPFPRVVGHVYEPTNAATGNAVAVFDRYSDGSLRPDGTVATGGLGTGVSLASQGGIVRDGDLLFVVNAGDDSVSVLRVSGDSVRLRDRIASGGDNPVSVTVDHGVGYVLNRGSDAVSGFTYDGRGDLRTLPFSSRSLTPNPAGGLTDAAQVQFAPDGHTLVVTERASQAIDTFVVPWAYAGGATSHPSAGNTPYGFDFDRRGTLVVSEAASGSASSYRVSARTFSTLTAALGDTQAAACWVVVSDDHAYVVNAASGSVSSYRIDRHGALTLEAAVAATTGAGPTDAAVSPDGHSLHVRMRDGSVASFAIGRDGSLTPVGTAVVTAASGPAGLVTD